MNMSSPIPLFESSALVHFQIKPSKVLWHAPIRSSYNLINSDSIDNLSANPGASKQRVLVRRRLTIRLGNVYLLVSNFRAISNFVSVMSSFLITPGFLSCFCVATYWRVIQYLATHPIPYIVAKPALLRGILLNDSAPNSVWSYAHIYGSYLEWL